MITMRSEECELINAFEKKIVETKGGWKVLVSHSLESPALLECESVSRHAVVVGLTNGGQPVDWQQLDHILLTYEWYGDHRTECFVVYAAEGFTPEALRTAARVEDAIILISEAGVQLKRNVLPDDSSLCLEFSKETFEIFLNFTAMSCRNHKIVLQKGPCGPLLLHRADSSRHVLVAQVGSGAEPVSAGVLSEFLRAHTSFASHETDCFVLYAEAGFGADARVAGAGFERSVVLSANRGFELKRNDPSDEEVVEAVEEYGHKIVFRDLVEGAYPKAVRMRALVRHRAIIS